MSKLTGNDEIETFGGLKARLVAGRSDPRMLPRQVTGVCYVHTALNTILNTPALMTAVMTAVKTRIDRSKYSSALGGQNLRRLDRSFTSSPNRQFVGNVGAVDVRVIKDILNKVSSSQSDEALKQWCKDTILYTALRDAKAADFTKYNMNYEQNESADSLYLAVARQDILQDYGTVNMETLVAAGEGGKAVVTLFDILASVGATVYCSNDDFTATFPDGTCFFANKSNVPENTQANMDAYLRKADSRVNVKNFRAIENDFSGWDRTGQFSIRRKNLLARPNEEGHVVMYYRDDNHVVHVIDSNHHRTWTVPEYLEDMNTSTTEMLSVNGGPPRSTMCEHPWMVTEFVRCFAGKAAAGAQSGGGFTGSEIPDALAAQIAGTCIPMSEEAQIAGGILRELLKGPEALNIS
jgi:hypothetical protein